MTANVLALQRIVLVVGRPPRSVLSNCGNAYSRHRSACSFPQGGSRKVRPYGNVCALVKTCPTMSFSILVELSFFFSFQSPCPYAV